jgi:hypothetical protein
MLSFAALLAEGSCTKGLFLPFRSRYLDCSSDLRPTYFILGESYFSQIPEPESGFFKEKADRIFRDLNAGRQARRCTLCSEGELPF